MCHLRSAACWLLLLAVPAIVFAAEPPIDYQRDIRPILARHCFRCHGRSESEREGGLRLDERSSALAPADSGEPAIVPGKPDESTLLARVTAEDEERMPPPDEGKALAPAEIERLRRWIDQGAPYARHWSFVPPKRRPLPRLPAGSPKVRDPIDVWVLHALAVRGLKPSPPADRYELIRRLSFDLRGIPPSVSEIEAFVADRRPDAYERLVDRFLADPAYGEQWARLWLDLARYADSRGFGSDPLRKNMWRYRDWVIDAFNRNLPYDQFTIEQLAGDLLPHPTIEQRMATAFHRNTMTNTEGGTDDEEFRVAAVRDRVDTTMQVWMGLTMQCGKCHSHKYDPISQREYYQFYAFFNQTADADRADEAPTIEVPRPTDRLARERHARQVAALEEQLRDLTESLQGATAVERKKLTALKKRLARLKKSAPRMPTLPVMQELPPDKRRQTHIMIRGNFLSPGELVRPAVPKAFHPWKESWPRNRLGVAYWIVDRSNPLTARVAVNRIWAQLFGRGIVATEEDFGTQGDLPTHPELLDELAVRFMELRWDQKELLRSIVGSATYRRTARATADQKAKDPDNRWLSRGPRVRLTAEQVRDQALAVSGLLSRKIGGPSVYPYQPPGLWRAAFNGQRKWPTSRGENKYRRGIYTFWRRTVPYPSMAAWDAPSREVCTIRRSRTNTPLQAFVTLNDPVYVEAAQALGRRLLGRSGSDAQRLAYGYLLVRQRRATPAALQPLQELLNTARRYYAAHEGEARTWATDPLGPLPREIAPAEAAAWTVIGNTLLNLDGIMSK